MSSIRIQFPNDWESDGIIGQGSFGVVYRAKRVIGRNTEWAAIKHISMPRSEADLSAICSELGTRDERTVNDYLNKSVQDMLSEYFRMKQLQGYTNIVSCQDIQQIPKKEGIGYDVYIWMELLDSLDNRMIDGKIDRKETIRMGMDICRALNILRSKGIVHRDIKPQNILVNDHGDYKLGDFGSAKGIRGTSTILTMKGTLSYTAPEIVMGKPAGFSSDIYSLGLVMYRLMNRNRHPFVQEGDISNSGIEDSNTRRWTGEEIPMPVDADWELGKIILKACAYEPRDRWQTPEDMFNALAELGEGTIPDGPNPPPEDPPVIHDPHKPFYKKLWFICTLSGVGILIIALILTMALSKARTSKEAKSAPATELLTPSPASTSISTPTLTPTPEPTEDPTPSATPALDVPALTSVSNKTEGVQITWEEVSGAEQYRVFRKEQGSSWKQIADIKGTAYIDQTVSSGVEYTYTVRCLSSDGQTYASSYDKTGITATYIAMPELVSVTNTTYGVTVKWKKVTGAENYGVFRKDGSGNWKKIGNTTGTTYSDKTAKSGTAYTYTVRCLSQDGEIYTSAYDPTGLSIEIVAKAYTIKTIATGYDHVVGLRADGTVVAVGENGSGQCDVNSWTYIVAVAAGNYHTVGLRADGTVAVAGHTGTDHRTVSSWRDIVAIAAGGWHTVGLRADGTVVAAELINRDSNYGQIDVSSWTDIVAIAAGVFHTVGLKADGTVVATGQNHSGQCDVDSWTDIVVVAAGNSHTVGLRADGTVVATGSNYWGQCEVDSWTDIVAIAAGEYHTVGLRADGTVVATKLVWIGTDYGQTNVSGWTDIVAVAAGGNHTVGLRADGTAVATGKYSGVSQQVDASDLRNIRLPEQ